MNLVGRTAAVLGVGALAAFPLVAGAELPWLRPVDAIKTAVDAYIYGYRW
jgi:hypothetical protein